MTSILAAEIVRHWALSGISQHRAAGDVTIMTCATAFTQR
jgi:hypothetical protein